ncbi:MAG: cysteine desulfurase [Pyrinomonadaceae bacterium]|nr:cysteine desulfurase [Pyrinomonadaceae bacterium]
MFRRVYLDNSASTAADPAVVAAMLPYFSEFYGNASSIHFQGQKARAAIDKARHQVAELINARPNEVIFTSGGTESNNLAIRGLVEANEKYGKHIITSAFEHSAVKNVCEDLEARGYSVTRLPVYSNGVVRAEDLRNAITDETILITVMMANNEIGTIQPVEEIGRIVRGLREAGRKIWFHTDAIQAAGKVSIDVEAIGCDLLSISAHKIYAPKGSGALYVRRGTRLHAQNIGGRQERGLRAGTEPVANIVAIGEASSIARSELSTVGSNLQAMRDRFESRVCEAIPDIVVNGLGAERVPNVSNISFDGVEGEGLLINLDMHGVAVSTGSACSSGSIEPSRVIKALGRDDSLARGAIRFSFGKFNTDDDVDHVLEVLPAAVENLRKLNPARSSTAGK